MPGLAEESDREIAFEQSGRKRVEFARYGHAIACADQGVREGVRV